MGKRRSVAFSQRLNVAGRIDPRQDEERLPPGRDWDMEIEKAVEAADAVVVCLSNNSVNKEGYIQKEIRNVERQIANIDNEVDQRVYQLYGLTEEEIMIVEGK